MAEDDRGRLVAGDWDGITRAAAVRELLRLADEERQIYAPTLWWRRLVALVRVCWGR